jgi:hypothetical protein
MPKENCAVHRELLCLKGPAMFTGKVMSTANCDVHRELCLQGLVVYRNCDVYREL